MYGEMDVCQEQMLACHGEGEIIAEHINGQIPAYNMLYYSGGMSSALDLALPQRIDPIIINCASSYGITDFHLNCTVNNPALVKPFLDQGANVNSAVYFNSPSNPGFTPLHYAVASNCTDVVELLLRYGADANKCDEEGNTPLHLACDQTDLVNGKIIDLLLQFGLASPCIANSKGITPLHLMFHKVDLSDRVLDEFCWRIPRNVNITDDAGLSYFHVFCTIGDTSRVSEILESGVEIDRCVESGSYRGYTALHFAVLCNQRDVVELLLRNNAQVNVATHQSQLTPLHIACIYYMKYRATDVNSTYDPASVDGEAGCQADLAIVELLLRHGADVDAQDRDGNSALILSCTINDFENVDAIPKKFRDSQKAIVDVLLAHNANINARAKRGRSLLHVLARSDFSNSLNEGLVEHLIDKGADVNATDAVGMTPLHVAVEQDNASLVLLFLRYRSNINAKTSRLYSPLELAIRNMKLHPFKSNKDVIATLLQNGADVNAVSEVSGVTILEEAVNIHDPHLVHQLLKHEADLNIKGTKKMTIGNTLSSWCRRLTNIELLRTPTYGQVAKLLFTHVKRLAALDIQVDPKIDTGCTLILQRLDNAEQIRSRNRAEKKTSSFTKLMNIGNDCAAEVKRMKAIKLSGTISLFDVLYIDIGTLSKLMRNNTVVELMGDTKSFPMYSVMLRRKFFQALRRRSEMEKARMSLNCISGMNLPDICRDKILKYLTTTDIADMNIAVRRAISQGSSA